MGFPIAVDPIPWREQGDPRDGEERGGAGHREGGEQPAVDERQLWHHPQVPRRPKQVRVTPSVKVWTIEVETWQLGD